MSGRILISSLLLLCGCAETSIQTIPVNDPRIGAVIIESHNQVGKDCHTDRDDHGNKIGSDFNIRGCYFPPNGPIIISESANLFYVLRHELCHAITGLERWECDNLYPAISFSLGYTPIPRQF